MGSDDVRVLFTTPVLEHPAAGGPQLRIENSIKALSKVCSLFVLVRITKEDIGGDPADAYFRQFCSELEYMPPLPRSGQKPTQQRLQSLLTRVRGGDVARQARILIKAADGHGAHVIWFGFGNISYPLMEAVKRLRPSIKIVCDTDSVWSRFVLRGLPFEEDPQKRAAIEREGRAKEAEEQAWVNLCEITTAVSEVDAQYYRAFAAEPSRIRLFANVIDVDGYEIVPEAPEDLRNPCAYFAGTFGFSAMDTAARWLLDEVWPKVRAQVPEARLYFVGRNSDRSFSDMPQCGLHVEGRLPSVLPYLCHADVAVVPLKFESGTRFKILEAGACGIPLVSTTLGAEGIPVSHGRDILIADEPEAFARAIVEIMTDRELAQKLADRCRALVRSHYSVQALADQAAGVLDSLSVRPAR